VQAVPMKFAWPSVVMREDDTNSGAVEIFQPSGDAVAES
jgi:gamma-glutamyltranspeptidase/glutathione hydrolase